MAVFLSTTPSHHLHHKFVLSLPSHCFSQQAPSRWALFFQEIWQRFSLQLTITSPPSKICLKFTFALLFTANAFTLRLIFVKIYGSVSLYFTSTSSPSQVCLEFTFALLSTANAFTLRLNFAKGYGSESLYILPSHHLR